MKILIVIPARGGSKGIPKKNIRLIAGKPLIAYSIMSALSIKGADVVISTDDPLIELVSINNGARVIVRPEYLGEDHITLDPVIHHAVTEMEKIKNKKYDIVITMQPTSPTLKVDSLTNALDSFIKEDFDTMLSGEKFAHLSWRKENNAFVPNYEKRLNRQYLEPNYNETGAFVITKRQFVSEFSRFGTKISIYPLSDEETVDIDTYIDWSIAENILSRKTIAFIVAGNKDIGLGHVYRTLTLLHAFTAENIVIFVNELDMLACDKFKENYYDVNTFKDNKDLYNKIDILNPDIIVCDILNTKVDFITNLKRNNRFVVTFEDLGEGSKVADITINALYDHHKDFEYIYSGSKYYCMRDEFIYQKPSKFKEQVKLVLITYGGTDPNNLTQRMLKILNKIEGQFKIRIVLGLGYENISSLEETVKNSNKKVEILKNVHFMSNLMKDADIAFSSYGRTAYELCSMQVPTFALAQNNRELHHEFVSKENGFIEGGLHSSIKDDKIKNLIEDLIYNTEKREQLYHRMETKDLTKGILNVKNLIYTKFDERK